MPRPQSNIFVNAFRRPFAMLFNQELKLLLKMPPPASPINCPIQSALDGQGIWINAEIPTLTG